MLKMILSELKEFFSLAPTVNRLEEYIVRNNPQSVHDVEMLTQEFERLNSRHRFEHYFYK